MAGVMLAMFLSSLDGTIVSTAMPKIVADVGHFEQYTWISIAYLIASTVTILIAGKIADMYGRKRLYMIGIGIFLLGSLLCGLSQTMTQIIGFRAFQGIGGGIMMACAFTVVGDLFAPSERGKFQGLTAAVFGLSSVAGPSLGGYITDHYSWHWIFFVNIPLGIVVIALFMFFFPTFEPDELRPRPDYPGIAALILTVVPTMVALSWGGVEYPWSSWQIISMFVFSSVMCLLFLFIENRSEEPLLPLWLFKDRIVAVSVLVSFVMGIGMFGVIYFVPLFFQGVLGTSATDSGTYLTPMMLGLVAGSVISGQVLSRAGGHYRLQGAIGLLIMMLGMYLLSRMTPATATATAVRNIVIVGVGLGVLMPLYTIAVQNAVPYKVMGVATSATAFFRQIGGAFGLAILGAIMTNRFSSGFFDGLPAAVNEAIPKDQLNKLASNPEFLVDASSLAKLSASFHDLGLTDVFDQFILGVREALSSAVTHVFLIGVFVILAAWMINLFVKEIPLRKKHFEEDEPEDENV
jgi:EmrB/QacA subfamily drug resistance transporter